MDGTKANLKGTAFAKVVRLVSVRDRSIKEIHDRLLRDGFAEDDVLDAIERAVQCNLLDDERFAKTYITSKRSSGWGFERIEHSLKSFGVTVDSIEGYPYMFSSEADEIERALQELARFSTKAKNLRDARYRRLFSKGYAVNVIQIAVERFENCDCE